MIFKHIAAFLAFTLVAPKQVFADNPAPDFGWSVNNVMVVGKVEDEVVRDFISSYTHIANVAMGNFDKTSNAAHPIDRIKNGSLLLISAGPSVKVGNFAKSDYIPKLSENLSDRLAKIDLGNRSCFAQGFNVEEWGISGVWGLIDTEELDDEASLRCLLNLIALTIGQAPESYASADTSELVGIVLQDLIERASADE